MMRRSKQMPDSSPLVVLLALSFALACERSANPPPVDSAITVTPGPADTAASSARSMWDAMLGPVFVVAGDDPGTASVIFPLFSDSTLTDTTTFDTAVATSMRFDLFSTAGQVGSARLQPVIPRARDGCVAWPEAEVTMDTPAPGAVWTVGFAAGRVTPLELDSLENLAGADSARLTAEVARLASLVPADTAAAFHGIPFFVRQVRRFRTGAGTEVLIANVTRRINQEANPREEQLLLLAERDPARVDGRYVPAFHERVSGHEEAIETTDVLAAMTFGTTGQPVIVLIRDYGDGTSYAFLTRTPVGEWRIGWSSAYAGC